MSERDEVAAAVENELTLLSRYHAHAQRAGFQLDRSAYLLLGRLELEHPLSLKQLAEAFRLDISTVNRQIASLRTKGLVERINDPDGGIARLLRPTRRGLALLHRDRTVRHGQVSQVLDDWPPQDVERLHALLAKFNSSIEALEGQAWPRP